MGLGDNDQEVESSEEYFQESTRTDFHSLQKKNAFHLPTCVDSATDGLCSKKMKVLLDNELGFYLTDIEQTFDYSEFIYC